MSRAQHLLKVFFPHVYYDEIGEEIYGYLAVGYHRTTHSGMMGIVHNDKRFLLSADTRNSKMYGPGIYMTYNLFPQLHGMANTYGGFLIKSRINLRNFLIFDPHVAQKVYGYSGITIGDQLRNIFKIHPDKFLGLELSQWIQGEESKNKAQDPEEQKLTSYIALALINHVGKENMRKFFRGVVFTGLHDGEVFVVYDDNGVLPFAWAQHTGGSREPQWKNMPNGPRKDLLGYI